MRWLVVVALAGCGGGRVDYRRPPVDAGAGDADAEPEEDAGPVEPTLPAPPSLPADPLAGGPFLDCAPGFEVEGLDVPAPPGCRPNPDECPEGDFADAPEGVAVIDVRLGIDSIADAIATAGPDDMIRLSKGTLDEAVDVDRPVTLLGACPAETVLDGTVTLRDGRLMSLSATEVHVATGDRSANLDRTAIGAVFVDAGLLYASDVHGGSIAAAAGAVASVQQSSLFAMEVRGDEARIDAMRVVVRGGGASTADGGYLVASDLVVVDAGIDIAEGSRIDLARSRVADGVVVEGAEAIFVGIDVTLGGLDAEAQAELARASIESRASIAGAVLTASDATFAGGATCDDGEIRLTRALVQADGIVATNAGIVTGSDVAVLQPAGAGISLESASYLDLERVLVQSSHGAGIVAFDAGTIAALRDLVVEPTLLSAEAAAGIASVDGAAIDVIAFRTSSSEDAGVLVARGGTLDLHGGEISDNPVGASVQTEGFDRSRLEDDVVFQGNEADFDTSARPVPARPGGA